MDSTPFLFPGHLGPNSTDLLECFAGSSKCMYVGGGIIESLL